MKAAIPSTAERFRRHQRDLRAYRQRSLWRRSHNRFHRDLAVRPHLFLAPGRVVAADLCRSGEEVVEALRGKAVWTLDTAGRLSCGIGFLATKDLTGSELEVFESGHHGEALSVSHAVDPAPGPNPERAGETSRRASREEMCGKT